MELCIIAVYLPSGVMYLAYIWLSSTWLILGWVQGSAAREYDPSQHGSGQNGCCLCGGDLRMDPVAGMSLTHSGIL